MIDPDDNTETGLAETAEDIEEAAPTRQRADRADRSYVDLPYFGATMFTHPDDQ